MSGFNDYSDFADSNFGFAAASEVNYLTWVKVDAAPLQCIFRFSAARGNAKWACLSGVFMCLRYDHRTDLIHN